MTRSPVAFLAWAPSAGRARDLAADLGGDALTVYPSAVGGRRTVPLRYALSSVITVGHLLRRRPRAVVVQNPPVYPALISALWVRLVGGRLVLDNHPTSFGAKGNVQASRMLAVTRRLVRRADGVLVTTSDWADVVRGWGGHPVVLHEAPPQWSVSEPRPLGNRRPVVLFSCVFASDEPVSAVIEAARRLPELDMVVTGDQRRAPRDVLADLPANVTMTGWLDQQQYARQVDRCDVLLALTTEPTSVMRAAYEAGYARRLLVLSDWPASRALFPEAVGTGNTADAITAALRTAVADHDLLIRDLDVVQERQRERWRGQRRELRALLGLDEPSSRSASSSPGQYPPTSGSPAESPPERVAS